ncbi:transporter substrate-binding domain-containing protein [Streptomyces sp. QTS52]
MNHSVRLSGAVLAVAALSGTACSSTTSGKTVETSASPTTKEPTAAAPKAPLFPSTVYIGVKIDQPGFNVLNAKAHGYAGFEKQLADFLGRNLNFSPELVDILTADREKKLMKGSVQLVIATYSITPERLKMIDFVGPYLKTEQGLLVRDGDSRIKKKEDAAGKDICTVQGSTSMPDEDNENKNPLHKDANFKYKKDYKACVDSLIAHNVDAVWTDKAILYGFTEGNDVQVVEDIEVGKEQLYGIGIAKGHPEQCKALVVQLKKFLETEWYLNFKPRFPNLVRKDQDFESNYKPSEDDVSTYTSCDG